MAVKILDYAGLCRMLAGLEGRYKRKDGSTPWSKITERPSTLAGYGIIDAYTKTEINSKNFISVIDAINTVDTAQNWSAIRTDMKVRFYDVYKNGGPTDYGNVMEISGRSGHWQPQLWFDGEADGQMRFRNHGYMKQEWGAWKTVLTDKNYTDILGSVYQAKGDYYTKTESDGKFVNKAGGTMTGALTVPKLYINGGGSTAFLAADNSYSAYINVGGKVLGFWSANEMTFRPSGIYNGQVSLGQSTARWSTVYANSLNVASNARVTNLNADLLDGLHADEIRKNVFKFKSITGTSEIGGYDLNTLAPDGGCISNYSSYSYWANAPAGALYGMALHLVTQYNIGGQLFADINHNSSTDVTRSLWWRASGTVNDVKTWGKWHQIAFTDGNVVSATKLQTAREINGTAFDGTGGIVTMKWGTSRSIRIQDYTGTHVGDAVSVDGSTDVNLKLASTMSFLSVSCADTLSAGRIRVNGANGIVGISAGHVLSINEILRIDGYNPDGTAACNIVRADIHGNVAIAAANVDSAYKLLVGGDVKIAGSLCVGSGRLRYDAQKNAIVFEGNLIVNGSFVNSSLDNGGSVDGGSSGDSSSDNV